MDAHAERHLLYTCALVLLHNQPQHTAWAGQEGNPFAMPHDTMSIVHRIRSVPTHNMCFLQRIHMLALLASVEQ